MKQLTRGEKISATKIAKNKVRYIKEIKDKFKGKIEIVEYSIKGVNDISTLRCKKHGEFKNTLSYVLSNKHGCNKCADESRIKLQSKPEFAENFYTRMEEIGLQVLTKYTGSYNTVRVKCITHKYIFDVTPNSAVHQKFVCPKCVADYRCNGMGQRKTEKVVRQQLLSNHNGNIKLLDSYNGARVKHRFKCMACNNIWEAIPDSLTRTTFSGCPKCNNGKPISNGEQSLYDFVNSLFPSTIQSYRELKFSESSHPFEIDIYIPELKFGIEYNGLYHHSYPSKPKNYHFEKRRICEEAGIKLIHVYEDDWINKQTVVKKTIRHLLGLTKTRYYARKLTVKSTLDISKVRKFYNKNHMLGAPTSGITYVLLDSNLIVAAMTFSSNVSSRGKSSKDTGSVELIRYASIGSVVGGASRLFSAFLRNNPNIKSIVSYSDNDLFDGQLYEKLGFSLVKNVKYDYKTVWYENGSYVRKHKSFSRKANLAKLLGKKFNPNKTEEQNLLKNNILIIYDSGKKKWVYTK